MTKGTLDIIGIALQNDATVSREDAITYLNILREPQGEKKTPPDILLSRHAVAAMIGKAPQTVDRLAREGVLIRRYAGKNSRKCIGYSRQSVMRVINGEIN